MLRRQSAWMVLPLVAVILLIALPPILARHDLIYRTFGPLLTIRAHIHKFYIDPVDDRALVDGAIRGMLERLDPFCTYLSPDEYPIFRKQNEGEFSGIGVEIDQRDGQITVITPIEDTPAWQAGILPGDRILEINGMPTSRCSLFDAVRLITGPPGTPVTLRVLSEGAEAPRVLRLRRTEISVASVRGWLRRRCDDPTCLVDPERRIGYLRITNFRENTPALFDDALAGLRAAQCRALVIDLRRNPGGLLPAAVAIADRFISDGVIVSTRGRSVPEAVYHATPRTSCPDWPVAVLIDRNSASASEILAGALQDHGRAVIVGERSYGKGSVQNAIELDNGGAIKLTVAYYYLPSGRRIHRGGLPPEDDHWGIHPDIPVELTPRQQSALEEFTRQLAEVRVRIGHEPTPPDPALVERLRTRLLETDPVLAEAVRTLARRLPAEGTFAERVP